MRTVVYKASQVVQKHFMMVKKLQGTGLLHVEVDVLCRALHCLKPASRTWNKQSGFKLFIHITNSKFATMCSSSQNIAQDHIYVAALA